MRPVRYLAAVPAPGAREKWHERIEQLGRSKGLSLHAARGYLLLTSEPPLPVRPGEAGSTIIGSLYAKSGRTRLFAVPIEAAEAIDRTVGASLIERFWGDYIAVIDHPTAPAIVRAPFGDLPCYIRRTLDATLVASDIDLLMAGSATPTVDWHAVALQLIAPDIRRPRTCLADIEELACGDRGVLQPHLKRETLWSPWDFVTAARRCDDSVAAAARLRSALLDTVAAQTDDDFPNILCLSGGVDSSIAAAALAAGGRTTQALTMVTRDPAGDERSYARTVARHCGMPLAEVARSPAGVDLTRSEARGLPYPTETAFSQATRAALTDMTGSATARVLHGGGGDQIFCSLQSAAPLADLLRAKGWDRRIPALTLDLARVANTSAGAVVSQALRRIIGRRSSFRWPSALGCLTPAAARLELEALQHPWLSPPSGTGSASAGHVALAMGALGIVQSPAWDAQPPWRAILLSQPVVEACLTVPAWLWFERGRNRAIARRAVEGLLPATHVWRPGKGAMASFMIEIFDANRPLLREMIGDGRLVAEGLVDRAACLKILDDPQPVRGTQWSRLLQLADIEAWLASW